MTVISLFVLSAVLFAIATDSRSLSWTRVAAPVVSGALVLASCTALIQQDAFGMLGFVMMGVYAIPFAVVGALVIGLCARHFWPSHAWARFSDSAFGVGNAALLGAHAGYWIAGNGVPIVVGPAIAVVAYIFWIAPDEERTSSMVESHGSTARRK